MHKSSRVKVLVTDAQMRNSVAIIRSLGSRGLEVTAGEETRFATGFFSRYCGKRIVYPSPSRYPDKFVEFLLDIVKRDHYRVIFPVTNSTVLPLAKHKQEFRDHALIPLPDYGLLTKALDKAETIKVALENGIPCPNTHIVNDVKELSTLQEEIGFPVVIKPRISFGARGFALCHSRDELLSAYPKVVAAYGPCIVQEYIPLGGDELGVYVLLNHDSELRAITVHKRLRSYPISGGPSTLRETVENHQLVELALKLLKAIKWWGIAMVEFRTDPRDNQPKLMEINPRWWGSLQLSILAGVDFPYLLYRLVTEGDVKPSLNYKVGVRCRWLLPGDILWFLNAPKKPRNLLRFLKFEKNNDIISLKDPGPTFGFLLASLRFAFDADMWRFVLRKPMVTK